MDVLFLETDQRYCYDVAGKPTVCAGSGQDAAQSKSLPSAAARFQISGAVVKDIVTGAIWTQDANPAQFPLTWEEARAFAADMAARKAHGYENWQLPPRRLLFTLVSHQTVNPSLPMGHPFENVFSGYYWTADTCHRLPEQAWHIHMGGGRIPRAGKQDASLLWPVCLPKECISDAYEAERFALDGGVVQDRHTGLIWSRNAAPVGEPLTWEQALAALAAYNRTAAHGAADWRMPNIRELESLVDLSADSPALSAVHPFLQVRDVYWSSTTSVYEPRYAWALYTRDGMIGVGFKPEAQFYLWPVRGGV